MSTESDEKRFASTDPGMILNVQSFLARKFQGHDDESGTAKDWQTFHSTYDMIIRRFAATCGMQDFDIDECSQEVWVAVVHGIRDFEHDPKRARFRSWLYRIVSNKAADIVRSRVKHSAISLNDSTRMVALQVDAPLPEQNLESAWRNELLRASVNQLKQQVKRRDFRVFVDRTIRNKPVADVAEAHQMSDGAVRVVDHRLRKHLQKILQVLTDGQIVAEFG